MHDWEKGDEDLSIVLFLDARPYRIGHPNWFFFFHFVDLCNQSTLLINNLSLRLL